MNITSGLLLILLWAISAGSHGASTGVESAGPEDFAARCKALERADFSQIPEAPTQLIETKSVNPSGAAVGYCQVSGYVAPSTGFAIRLPATNWNGKLIELGCSAKCGTLEHIARCEDPLRRGYACVVSDGGHKSTMSDAKWAYHNFPALMDYLVRASHVTALAGKAIVRHYYGQAPEKSYFMGCSAGGTQAMQEAQKFPWDFDGIVAGAPALSWTANHVSFLWNSRALINKSGDAVLQQSAIDVLHEAVLRKCDLNDGVKDGLIGDPRDCHFDPAELLCTAAKKTACLSEEQVAAVKKIYGGPVTTKGGRTVLPSALLGSERTWLGLFGGWATDAVSEGFRYQDFQPNPGPTWRAGDFDFDQDYKRLGVAGSLEPLNPDLQKFKAAGGKLLAYTGWTDTLEGVPRTVDYYEMAERVNGPRTATQEFFRLFVIPGMNHCGGGDGASVVDWLSYLEGWREENRPPERLISSHLKSDAPIKFPLDPATVEFSRPVYPYPVNAKYLGSGDPKDARSFGPVEH